jgi:transforming growth factor-beta-induced protein
MLSTTLFIFVAGFLFQAAIVQTQVVDIVQTAINNGNFKILVTALQAADLVPTLKSTGPFTVFAPTDAAFAKLPPGTITDLLKPENKQKLIRILLYHVVAGNLTAAAIIALNPPVKVKTIEGSTFLVTKDGNNLKVNDATVIIPNVFATNGIIHAIDTVLMPPADMLDIVDTAINNGNFKILVTALQAADLVTTLKSTGPFTVFAPTDAAFAKLPPGTLVDLLKPENKQKLIEILTYHVVVGNLTAAAIIALNPPVRVKTLEGRSVLVTIDGNKLMVNDATVIIPNVFATNGIIHAIDTVLLPRQVHRPRRHASIALNN